MCKVFGHRWGYSYDYKRDITYTSNELPLLEPVRCCSMCKEKEFANWDLKSGEFKFGPPEPSIAEKREIKLKMLGIK